MSKPWRPLLPATATVSLGQPGVHDIIPILHAAADAGINGIEIFYNHLHYHALKLSESPSSETDQAALIKAAQDIRRVCYELHLAIIVLQPFMSYDGLVDDIQHKKMIDKFINWLEIANALGCDVIQVPSNFLTSGTLGDIEKIVADITEIAKLAGEHNPPVRLAYEAISWGAHIDLWEQSWDVVERVNRDNVGLCLDTFHIAGRVFADPASSTGKNVNGEADLAASVSRLVKEVDVEKIFYIQLSDAERLETPLVKGHPFYNEEQPSRMSWSRNARLFPCEENLGGYMPVLDIVRGIVNDLGYRGWISMEIFSRHLAVGDANVPDEYAQRAMASYGKVREMLGWKEL